MTLSTTSSGSGHSRFKAIWLALLLVVICAQHASADAEALIVAVPGQVLGKTSQGWYALSLEGNSLVLIRPVIPFLRTRSMYQTSTPTNYSLESH